MTAPINIMLVDDSAVIRKVLEQILSNKEKFNIVAQAVDGLEAVEKLGNKQFADSLDIIILDIEMPRMDGLTALPKIVDLAKNAKVLMASTLTEKNAAISLKAMELGAADYLPKPTHSEENDEFKTFRGELKAKVRILGTIVQKTKAKQNSATELPQEEVKLVSPSIIKPSAIAIGSSTGGPDALKRVIASLDAAKLNVPIFITQHMPPHFTKMLAENLDKLGNLSCSEAQDGDIVKANHIYIAPGDFHMEIVAGEGDNKIIRTNQNPPENFCRPAVDPMVRSLSSLYGNRLLVCILTGMGSDGLKGAMIAKTAGATILSQNEETSTVWGMPAAVTNAGICSYVEPIDNIANKIMEITS